MKTALLLLSLIILSSCKTALSESDVASLGRESSQKEPLYTRDWENLSFLDKHEPCLRVADLDLKSAEAKAWQEKIRTVLDGNTFASRRSAHREIKNRFLSDKHTGVIRTLLENERDTQKRAGSEWVTNLLTECDAKKFGNLPKCTPHQATNSVNRPIPRTVFGRIGRALPNVTQTARGIYPSRSGAAVIYAPASDIDPIDNPSCLDAGAEFDKNMEQYFARHKAIFANYPIEVQMTQSGPREKPGYANCCVMDDLTARIANVSIFGVIIDHTQNHYSNMKNVCESAGGQLYDLAEGLLDPEPKHIFEASANESYFVCAPPNLEQFPSPKAPGSFPVPEEPEPVH